MRPYQHLIVSGVFSSGIYSISRSLTLSLASFFAGFLVDLDHIYDYWKQHPMSLSLSHFFNVCEEYRLKTVRLWLHSWELVVILSIVACFIRNFWLLGFLLGLAQHLFFDQIFNNSFPKSYFLVYRWQMHFKTEKVFKIQTK